MNFRGTLTLAFTKQSVEFSDKNVKFLNPKFFLTDCYNKHHIIFYCSTTAFKELSSLIEIYHVGERQIKLISYYILSIISH